MLLVSVSPRTQRRQTEEVTLAYDSWFQWIDILHCAIRAQDRRFRQTRLFVYSANCDNRRKDTLRVEILASYKFKTLSLELSRTFSHKTHLVFS